MPVIAVLTLLLQVACAVHCVRSGREIMWIYLIVFLPLIGCVVYLITQVLPDLQNNRGMRRAARRIGGVIDPQKDLRLLRDQLAIADNVDNRRALADECLHQGLTDEAADLYQSCLQGPFKEDPYLLLKLANTEFKQGHPEQCKARLEHLIQSNPDFNSTDGHLLFARSLEQMGEKDQALQEYAALADAYPGEEARVRYGLLLKETGQVELAVEVFRQSLLRAKRAPKYYQRKEKPWITIARENLAA